jgi:hypothetical protein
MALLSTLMILNVLGAMTIGFADGEKVVTGAGGVIHHPPLEINLNSDVSPEFMIDESSTAEEIFAKIMAQIEKDKTKSTKDR